MYPLPPTMQVPIFLSLLITAVLAWALPQPEAANSQLPFAIQIDPTFSVPSDRSSLWGCPTTWTVRCVRDGEWRSPLGNVRPIQRSAQM